MTVALSSPVCPLMHCQDDIEAKGAADGKVSVEAFEELVPYSPREKDDDVVMVMNPSYYSEDFKELPKVGGPNSFIGPALKRNIRAWCEATGLPTSITIHFKDRSFQLHKFPLVSRSGYLKRLLMESKEAKLPSDCPGGPEIFELVANFCYGSTILMEPSNVAALRCAADYLQMSEDYGRANLCERSDLYLTQVALQSWEDTVVVLQHCETLAPLAEQLHIVSRCIESLAFMACMELLDPNERKTRPGMSVESQFWSDFSASTRDSSSRDWWVQDLVHLPSHLFGRMIVAIRRQGMQEKYVGQVIMQFAERWIFGIESDTPFISKVQFKTRVPEFHFKPNQCGLVEAVVKLLPMERNVVPTSFLFALLRCSLASNANEECRLQLETRVSLQLEHATLNDLLLPSRAEKEGCCILTPELDCMERIVTRFVSRQRVFSDSGAMSHSMGDPVSEFTHCLQVVSAFSKIWDEYLSEIACDSSLTPIRFADLAEKIPGYARLTHDHLYKAIHTYLKVHPDASSEERLFLCRSLNCQKLSQEACTHAVQNDLMPLRMIVQAMFMQQLQTRTALNSHLESTGQSLRFDALRALATPACYRANATEHLSQHCESFQSRDSFRSIESLRTKDMVDEDGMPLGYTMKRDAAYRQASNLKADYQATESRLRTLEAELGRMRRVLEDTMVDEGATHEVNQDRTSINGSGLVSPAQVLVHRFVDSRDRQPRGGGGCMGQVPPLPTVPEECSKKGGASGCISQLKQANRSSSLFAKALQRLKFGSFRKGRNGTNSQSAVATASGPKVDAPAAVSWWPVDDKSASMRYAGPDDYISRTDSMPRPAGPGRVRHHHSRHNSVD